METENSVQNLQNQMSVEGQKNIVNQNEKFQHEVSQGKTKELHQMEVMEQDPNSSYLDGNYKILRTLGSGYTAKVKLARNSQDGKLYAVKIFKNTFSKETNLKTLAHEIEMISTLNHPNLVNLKEFKNDAVYTRKKAGKDGQKQYKCVAIVLEYAESGELFDYVARSGFFSEQVARTYFHQIIDGLEYLNSKGLCHRDIKPENLLFDDQFNIKLCDFGFSYYLSGRDGTGILHTVLGTESYMAPEIFIDKKYNGAAVDLFASGIVLFIMISGTPPFAKADPNRDPHYRLLNNQAKNETFWNVHSKNKPKKEFFSPEFKSFINCMLHADQLQRPSLPEIKQHPWYTGATVPMEELRSQFNNRRNQVEEQMEQEKAALRKKKEMEAKKKNNAVYTGVKGFRSSNESAEQFQIVEKDFGKDLNKQRQLRNLDIDCLRPNDFKSLIDPDYLLKSLLAYSLEQNNKITQTGSITIDDNRYKLKINDSKTSLDFSIEFLRLDEETIVVDFKKIAGNSFEFHDKATAIKKIIESI